MPKTDTTPRMVQSFHAMPLPGTVLAESWAFAENIMGDSARYSLGNMVENYQGSEISPFLNLAWTYLMDMYAYSDKASYSYSRQSAMACIAIAHAIVNNPEFTGVSRKTGNR